MSSSPPHSKKRRRFGIRRTGWVVFWGSLALAIVLSTASDHLVLAPIGAGVIALALTQGAAWLLKRKKRTRSRDGRSDVPSSGSARQTRVASPRAAPVLGDFALAREERPARQAGPSGYTSAVSHAPVRRGLKRPLMVLGSIACAMAVAALVVLWMCFDDKPLVVQMTDLSAESYEKAQQLAESLDPRTAGADGIRTLAASQDEVNLMLNYAAKRLHNAAARVELRPSVALVQASVEVPSSPFGNWLNVDAVLRETNGLPAIDKLTVGSLPVPAFVAEVALEQIMARFGATERGRIAKDMVKSVRLSDSQLRVVYEWRADLVSRARAALISPEDQARFRAYSDRLFEVVDKDRGRQSIELSQLMPPMFLLAKQRSAQGDGAQENRAAIITLAFFAFGRDLSAIIPAAASWRAPVPLQVTLYERDDLAQHFLVSAALAVEGGTPLSNAIGVYREVDDSRRTGKGKGFSFHDLVADRAGTRFGTLAAKSPQKLQGSLSAGVKESDFMPAFSDLAEEIPEAEFKRRYGGVGSPTYNNIMADIEARVGRTPLLR